MTLSLLNIGKVSIAILVAWLESVSVLVFVWNAFYAVYPIACIWSLFSVFILNSYGAFRNTDKIYRFLMAENTDDNFYINVLLSFLMALVGFLSKRFVLMVYFSPTVWLEGLSVGMVLLYSVYTMLNTLADMKQMSAFITFPRQDMEKGLRVFYTGSYYSIGLYAMLFYATVVRCHYKVLEVSISIASLITSYGGVYENLHYIKRLICFPIIGIGLYNVGRCANKIKQMGREMEQSVGWFEVVFFCMIFPAAYIQAFSSKLLALSSSNILPAICLDKMANYCRQGADALPCHGHAKGKV